MLAFIRLVLLVLFIVIASTIGLVICLVRPFHRDNVGLFSSWYAKASWMFGVKVEIRQSPDMQQAMPCVFVANPSGPDHRGDRRRTEDPRRGQPAGRRSTSRYRVPGIGLG